MTLCPCCIRSCIAVFVAGVISFLEFVRVPSMSNTNAFVVMFIPFLRTSFSIFSLKKAVRKSHRPPVCYQFIPVRFRLDALPNQLSGGQQQRVAIARALAAAPAIILADEPTGNLDSKTSQDVLSLLKVTSQKFTQTIVMITHNEEIAQLADRIIRIEDGRIVSGN